MAMEKDMGSIYWSHMAATTTGTQRPVDASALARISARLRAAPAAPWLHGEVARRMAERLPLIRLQPRRIIDWGAKLGASTGLLQQSYAKASVVCVDAAAVSHRQARAEMSWWSTPLWRKHQRVLTPDAVPDQSAELLWCNMALHFEADIEALLQRWRRCLVVDGFLMFSTLGPGSFAQLRSLYRKLDWPSPMAPLVDMHDLGDMLVQAGFAEPVMDQETITLTWASATAMLGELRSFGGNADPARAAGLRTPRWRERLLAALDARRDAQGRIQLEVELVYGHAFCPAPRAHMAPETSVSLQQMRAMMRSGRR